MRNDLPRLELTEDPNKNNEYIIYRYPVKKTTNTKMVSRKDCTKKISTTKNNGRKRKTRIRKSRKGFFNIFT
jgi:hypothetical protein